MSSTAKVISISTGFIGACLGAALLFAINKVGQARLDMNND